MVQDERYKQSIEVSILNVSRDEVTELKNYLENNCWLWRAKTNTEKDEDNEKRNI